MALAAACQPAAPPVIGLALPNWSDDLVRVIQDELAGWPDRGLPAIAVRPEVSVTGAPVDINVAIAESLVAQPGLVGVVGHGGSRESLTAAGVYDDAGVVQIVPTGTSRRLRDAGDWTFMLAPDDSSEGEFIAAFLVDRLRVRRVALFYVNDDYGVGLRDGVRAGLVRRGGSVVVESPVDEHVDHATLVDAAFLRATPEAVVVAARHVATGRIARRVRQRWPDLPVVAGDGAAPPGHLFREAGPAAESLYVVAFWLADAPDSASRAFVERFQRVAGSRPSSSQAMAYDGAMLLAWAAHEAGPRAGAVRDYLLSLGAARPAYRGVTGDITFLPGRPPRLFMARLRDGEFVPMAGQ